MMEILGLNVPDTVYVMFAGTIGKIANEIANLQRTEIAQIEEDFVEGKVGSSTMPQNETR
ncbi:lyase family protein [Cytobacillus purgationiresistens]|uniref:Adenylosuccinate lyase n=1 Tax=Cytobacillus purgationiresistens TaxID=863449 RepID=A0ABU0AMB2_9BACI|nr:lyase family protein [Cytobacillus purgationiresistens]MDQ0272372.1 adenylosuccinate lyase [Cytobacillus purgationiresistens]